MKKGTQYLITLVLAIIVVGGIFVIQGVNKNKAEKLLEDPELVNGLLPESVTYEGKQYLVPPGDLYENGTGIDGLPPINEPVFVSPSVADEYLANDLYGIDVEVDGEHRFYSYQILNWHVLVNDTFNGKNLLVSNCYFCRTPRVYEVDEEFGNAGYVYNNNFVLYDKQSESWWLQESGIAIAGDRTGEQLNSYPSKVMQWDEWRDTYPNGEVLSTDTGVERDYTRHPFGVYDDNDLIYFPLNQVSGEISPKWLVDAVETEDRSQSVVFSREIIQGFGVANEVLAGDSIVAMYDYDNKTSSVFSAEGPDGTLTFTYDFDDEEIRDEETDSVWNTAGLAIDGELEGTQLQLLETKESFWFCWAATHDTAVLSGAGEYDRNTVEEVNDAQRIDITVDEEGVQINE